MNERIKEIRETLNLSQEAFGKRIGITRASISNMEKGTRNPSEQTIISICREFDVNYSWLKEGLGEMFSDLPNTLIDQVAEEYDLDEIDKMIVKGYLQLSEDKRKVIKEYLQSIFINKKDD